MKKNLLFALLLFLIVILSISLAACDRGGITEDTTKSEVTTESEETTEAIACKHSYGEFVIVEQGNCQVTGKHVRTCTKCGDEDISYALGDHVYGDWESTVGSCTELGSRSRTCTVCGNVEKEDQAIGPHAFGEWVTVSEATCSTPAKLERTCSVCGESETQDGDLAEHTFGEWVVVQAGTCKTPEKQERACSGCAKTEQQDGAYGRHAYGDWIVTEQGNCLATGVLTRTCAVCDHKDITYALGDHVYSELIPEVAPTFFEDGMLTHYACSVCGKTFDTEKHETTDLAIPKLGTDLSVCLDGVEAARFSVDSSKENQITLSLTGLEVTKGQTVTICKTGDVDTVYQYIVMEETVSSVGVVKGNIDPESGKIRTSSVSGIALVIKKGTEKLELRMDGYQGDGIMIEVTSSRSSGKPTLFPMTQVDYFGDEDCQAYVFGIMGSDTSTSFRIIDTASGKTYGYSDISKNSAWDTWSYTRGENDEIAFTQGISDWWIAFDIGGDGEITLRRFNLPNTIPTPTLHWGKDNETVMDKVTLTVGSDEYAYYTWPLTNGAFSRTEMWLDGRDLENLSIYRTVVEVNGMTSFYIPGRDTTQLGCHYLSLVSIENDRTTVGKDRDQFKITGSGKFVIEHLPFCNVINVYDYVEPTPDPEPEPDPDLEGIVIEINGRGTEMNFVTYPDDGTTSYVYGYVELKAGDKLLIRDTESGAVWGYDDIDEEFGWNVWDYHRGENGEIVIDFAARYAFEFDHDGCKLLYITKVFAPKHGESFGMVFEGEREDVIFDSFDLSGSTDEFVWTLTHATTMNSSDITAYINENGLWFYVAMLDLEAGEKFSLKNLTTGDLIGADHLVSVTGDVTALSRDKDLIEVLKSGSFYIAYLPAFNSYEIECDTTDPLSEIYLYAGDEMLMLTPDENGDIFYEGFASKTYHMISLDDSRFSPLPIILDEAMDASLVDLTVYEDYYYAYPNKEGIYNLKYNVYTGILYLEFVSDLEEEAAEPYQIFISYDYKLSLKESTENPDELYHLGVTIGAWESFKVIDTDFEFITDMTLVAGTTGITTNGETIAFQVGGTYDFYINKYTHEVRLVASSGGTDDEIDFSDGIYLSVDFDDIRVYPNEDGIIKYIGLDVTDDTVISMTTLDYTTSLPIILDDSVSSSIAYVYASDDYYMVFFYKNGKANITYNVYTGIMHIEMTDVTFEGAKVTLFNGGSMTVATSDKDGKVVFEGFELTESGPILLIDGAYENLPMILDPAMDATLATLYEYEGTTMLIINSAGTYNLYYDLTTNIVLLEAVTETDPDLGAV